MINRSLVRIALVVALVSALALVPTALSKGKPGGASSSGPTLTGVVSGDAYGGTYTVTGTGFRPGEVVALTLAEANGCCSATNAVPDSSGSFTYTGITSGPGTYRIRASQLVRNRWTVVAEWSFQM